MNKKINIAILGCGRISKKHIQAIKQNSKKFNLIGFCDKNKNKLNKIKYKINKFNSINQLLNSRLKIDLVSICTPSGLHKIHAKKCLEKNFNVLIEKPMALTESDAKEIIKASKRYKKKVFICLQNRFNPTITFLKRNLEKKKLGKIYFVNINIFWHRPQSYYNQDYWRGTRKFDGGALINQSIHFVDLIIWFFGEIKKKQIIRSRLARNIETEDTATINILFRNRTTCSLSSTMLVNKKNYEGSITIIGKKGTIKIGGIALNEIISWNINGKEMSKKIKNRFNYSPNSVYGSGHKLVYKEIYKSLNGKKSKAIYGIDGIKSVKFIDELYKKNKLM